MIKKLFFFLAITMVSLATFYVSAIYFSFDLPLPSRPDRDDLSQNWYCVIDEYRETEHIIRIESEADWQKCHAEASVSIRSDFDESLEAKVLDMASITLLFSVMLSYGIVVLALVGSVYQWVKIRKLQWNIWSGLFVYSLPFCVIVLALAGYVR